MLAVTSVRASWVAGLHRLRGDKGQGHEVMNTDFQERKEEKSLKEMKRVF